MKTLFPLLFVAILGFLGCAATEIRNTMASWKGHHQSELIAAWGPPKQIRDDEQGGQIFIYVGPLTTEYPAATTTGIETSVCGPLTFGKANSPTPQTRDYPTLRIFWINRDGYVCRSSWRPASHNPKRSVPIKVRLA
jgi:hypothetical protein